jgi:nitrate reductase NapE
VTQTTATEPGKWHERIMFVVLAFLIWPFLATAFVGTYGFCFWIYFLVNGPPGPR